MSTAAKRAPASRRMDAISPRTAVLPAPTGPVMRRIGTRIGVHVPARAQGGACQHAIRCRIWSAVDRTELAWAAGFWDGEGWANLVRFGRGDERRPMAQVNQASSSGIPEVLGRFARAVACGEVRGPDIQQGREPLYRWIVSSAPEVARLADLLCPWLCGIKAAQFRRIVGQDLRPAPWSDIPGQERLAWAAGLWDGEGSVCLLKHRSHVGYFVPEASITQSSADGRPEVLLRMESVARGGFWYGPFKQKGSLLPVYRWKIFRRQEIGSLLDQLWPWLGSIKREQAERVLRVLATQQPLPRGNPAWGSRKTHCVSGHEYSTARIRPYRARTGDGREPRPSKQCLACVRKQARERRQRARTTKRRR